MTHPKESMREAVARAEAEMTANVKKRNVGLDVRNTEQMSMVESRKERIRNTVSLMEYILNEHELPIPERLPYEMYFQCPWHEDPTRNLKVLRDGNFFFCSECGLGGDIITYVTEKDDITFLAALDKLDKYIEERNSK